MSCEDYPCCGHTPQDPCEPQWYDQPGAFDTSRPGNEHALCDHENGDCDVEVEDGPEFNHSQACAKYDDDANCFACNS